MNNSSSNRLAFGKQHSLTSQHTLSFYSLIQEFFAEINRGTQCILLSMEVINSGQTVIENLKERGDEGRRQLDNDCFIRLINDFALS